MLRRIENFIGRHPRGTAAVVAVLVVVSRIVDIWYFFREVVPTVLGGASTAAAVLFVGFRLPDIGWIWTPLSWIVTMAGIVLLVLIFWQTRTAPVPLPTKEKSIAKSPPTQRELVGVVGSAPALVQVPADMRPVFVKELQVERASLIKRATDMGVQIWKLPTTVGQSQERQWRQQVQIWEIRGIARFEKKWSSRESAIKEIDAVAPQIVTAELTGVPPPAWRAELIGRLRAGRAWLERHDAESWDPQSMSAAISSQVQT